MFSGSLERVGYPRKQEGGYYTALMDELEREHEETPEEAHERAVEIAGKGNYEAIHTELASPENAALFEHETERVRAEYELDRIEFLTDNDREMFTILDLYDPDTAHHCLKTYEIAKEKMEMPIHGETSFAEVIRQREDVTLEQFYRACLFHDIGKVEVPRSVIRHHMGDGAMLGCMHRVYRQLYEAGKIPEHLGLSDESTNEEIDEALKMHHIRAVYFVPAKEVFADDPESLAEVQDFGFSPEESLMKMIQVHEPRGRKIFTERRLPVEAELVGSHHNYEGRKPRYPLAVDTLHITVDLADLLHIADVTQALSSHRSYKRRFRMPKVMKIIVEHVEDGKIENSASAYFCLQHELSKYEAAPEAAATEEEAAEDTKNLELVRAFIAKEKQGFDTLVSHA